MKYYSDVLDKFFDSEDECIKAEQDVLDKSKKAMERANREVELKAFRKDVTRLRKELDCALEKFYAAQHEYFNDYGRLYPSVDVEETEDETDECIDCENHDACDWKYAKELIDIYMENTAPLKENYPNLWNLFYGDN